jgi:hypothetical protein
MRLSGGGLEAGGAVGEHQGIARTTLAGRLQRGRLVNHPRIVHEQHRPGLLQREAHPARAVRLEHARLPADDVPAPDEDHRDKIDAVAMRAFRGRTPEAVRGMNAELVCLDVPARHGPQLREQRPEGTDELKPGRRLHHGAVDGLEPARESTVQRVVCGGLPVRAVRNQHRCRP